MEILAFGLMIFLQPPWPVALHESMKGVRSLFYPNTGGKLDLLSERALDGFEVAVEEVLEAAFAGEVELRRP